MSPTRRSKWGPLRSLLALSPILIGGPLLAYRQHYTLPEPIHELTNALTSLPQISESQILGYAKELSEDIGFRTVGTREHALADTWMVTHAEELKAQCDRVVRETGRKLECEVWRQEGSGSHRFDMMGRRLYKTYVNLSNIVVRISNGTAEGKEHAVLVNAHLDSTLPSPGAADDAVAVGIMLEVARVLVNTPDWTPKHAIILLFNHAEESLQDGSHLFSTQHPIRDTVRAVINLEAAGDTGRELLFQATSEEMIQAYSHVPRPFGTILANDIFSSGVILSDTDFRQFEYYLNVTGLDMAIVGNSYLYHMRKDLVENIEAGVAQNMAENTLALLQHLSSSESPLPRLDQGYTAPSTVFFSHLVVFCVYSFRTAKVLYTTLFVASLALVLFTYVEPAPALRKGKGFLREQGRGTVAVLAGILGAVIAPNIVAVIMQRVLGKGMSWFAVEFSALALYGPAALAGALVSQLLIGRVHERTVFSSILILQTLGATVIQFYGIGSAALLFLTGLPLFCGLLLNSFLVSSGDDTSLWAYAIGQAMPLVTGVQMTFAVCDFFVPLTGRIGAGAPADHIIASIVAVLGSYSLPLVLPFAHRFGHHNLVRFVFFLSVLTAVSMAVFSMRSPFDAMHQKRLFVLHLENVTTQDQHLHIAAADGAPGFETLVKDIALEFGAPDTAPVLVEMNHYNSQWDTLYPFSAFLWPYQIDLPIDPTHASPWSSGENFTISTINNVIDEAAGTRSFTIVVYHPGIIWTVIAFDAHVLEWTLDGNPPDEHARHHIKEASFYGVDTWTVDLVVKLPSIADRGILVNYLGIQEKGMWPAKRLEKEGGGRAMRLFEELDAWLEKKTAGTVDATLLGCIGGVTTI